MVLINVITGWVVGANAHDPHVRRWDCIFYDVWQTHLNVVRWTHTLDIEPRGANQPMNNNYNVVGEKTWERISP